MTCLTIVLSGVSATIAALTAFFAFDAGLASTMAIYFGAACVFSLWIIARTLVVGQARGNNRPRKRSGFAEPVLVISDHVVLARSSNGTNKTLWDADD